jgi:hypothetical protein
MLVKDLSYMWGSRFSPYPSFCNSLVRDELVFAFGSLLRETNAKKRIGLPSGATHSSSEVNYIPVLDYAMYLTLVISYQLNATTQ